MPIVVEHQPSPAALGMAAYQVGVGKRQQREEEQALDILREQDRWRQQRAMEREQNTFRQGLFNQQQIADAFARQQEFGYRTRASEDQMRSEFLGNQIKGMEEGLAERMQFGQQQMDEPGKLAYRQWLQRVNNVRQLRGPGWTPEIYAQKLGETLNDFDSLRFDQNVLREPTAEEQFKQNRVWDEDTKQWRQRVVRNGQVKFEPLEKAKAEETTPSTWPDVLKDRKAWEPLVTEALSQLKGEQGPDDTGSPSREQAWRRAKENWEVDQRMITEAMQPPKPEETRQLIPYDDAAKKEALQARDWLKQNWPDGNYPEEVKGLREGAERILTGPGKRTQQSPPQLAPPPVQQQQVPPPPESMQPPPPTQETGLPPGAIRHPDGTVEYQGRLYRRAQ